MRKALFRLISAKNRAFHNRCFRRESFLFDELYIVLSFFSRQEIANSADPSGGLEMDVNRKFWKVTLHFNLHILRCEFCGTIVSTCEDLNAIALRTIARTTTFSCRFYISVSLRSGDAVGFNLWRGTMGTQRLACSWQNAQ